MTAMAGCVLGETVLVTVQSQSQEEMDALTAAIDSESIDAGGGSRTTLGTIEATMSRIVDVDSPNLVTVPRSVPTLSLLGQISYSEVGPTWTITYETMRTDPTHSLNNFTRVLYATQNDHQAAIGDITNPCLQAGISSTECLEQLEQGYRVLATEESLTDGSSFMAHGITLTVADDPYSLVQRVTMAIPHGVLVDNLARQYEEMHPTDGLQKQLQFGIGMLFDTPGATNAVMFDLFNLIEKSNQIVNFHKENSYSIAKYVSFWTSQVESDESIHLAFVECALDRGHTLDSVEVEVNGQSITAACPAMQEKVNALNQSTCASPYALCTPVLVTEGTGDDTKTWFTIVVPVSTLADEITVGMLLRTNYSAGGQVTQTLSTLNFATRQPPQSVCSDSVEAAFDPISFTAATLYRGSSMVAEPVASTFQIANSSSLGLSMGIPEALLTLVLHPRESVEAHEFFEHFPQETLRLDEVRMSHALAGVELPQVLQNSIMGVSEGRSTIHLDPALRALCPAEETGTQFAYEDGFGATPPAQCVSTLDWQLTPKARPFSTPGNYFVFDVDAGETAAVEWLKSNVLGETQDSVAQDIYNRTCGLKPTALADRSRVYWLLPIYYWPDQSPIGLKDRTIISISWSIGAVSSRRRLLNAPEPASAKARLATKTRLAAKAHPTTNARPAAKIRRALPPPLMHMATDRAPLLQHPDVHTRQATLRPLLAAITRKRLNARRREIVES